jgi:hypothetical protein
MGDTALLSLRRQRGHARKEQANFLADMTRKGYKS